jgi:spore coat polysaccharide biosynthesis protein SpsF
MARVSVSVFLQARLGSTRLPKKILLPLLNKTVIEWSMDRLGKLEIDNFVLLCDEASEQTLKPLTKKSGFELFAGDANDVLKRYVDAAKKYNTDVIIRATGDNPLVSAEVAEASLLQFLRYNCDFFAFEQLPLGSGVEVVARKALDTAFQESTVRYDHEHVCPYIYNNPEQFYVVKRNAPKKWSAPNLRITLDTIQDYEYIKALVSKTSDNDPSLEELIALQNHTQIHHKTGVQ